jgi:hypothetical protein
MTVAHVRMGQRVVGLQKIGVVVIAVAINPEVPNPFVSKGNNHLSCLSKKVPHQPLTPVEAIEAMKAR